MSGAQRDPGAPVVDAAVEEALIARAWEAFEKAYAPYSHFKVGAAILTESGEVFTGCNVECAAYPHGVCAERVAVSSAVAAGHQRFKAIAIVTTAARPTPPCGGCRQFMAEFSRDLPVVYATHDTRTRSTLDVLLPDMFTDENM
jgi:cytidine deaminase